MTLSQAKIVHEFIRYEYRQRRLRFKSIEDRFLAKRALVSVMQAQEAMQAAESILQEAQSAAEAGGKR